MLDVLSKPITSLASALSGQWVEPLKPVTLPESEDSDMDVENTINRLRRVQASAESLPPPGPWVYDAGEPDLSVALSGDGAALPEPLMTGLPPDLSIGAMADAAALPEPTSLRNLRSAALLPPDIAPAVFAVPPEPMISVPDEPPAPALSEPAEGSADGSALSSLSDVVGTSENDGILWLMTPAHTGRAHVHGADCGHDHPPREVHEATGHKETHPAHDHGPAPEQPYGHGEAHAAHAHGADAHGADAHGPEAHDHAAHDHAAHDHVAHDHVAHDHVAHDHVAHDHVAHDHVAHDHVAHDHVAHDHKAHDHAAHDHAAHDHAAHDHAAHDHAAHDHAAHDHAAHDHAAHDHAERPPEKAPCQGSMAVQLDLEAMLPGERDEAGRFLPLREHLLRRPGLAAVHLRSGGAGLPWLCVHLNDVLITQDEAIAEIRTISSRVAERYRQKVWFVRDMDSPACAEVIEHVLGKTPGVLSALVAYGSERLVLEYDATLLKPADVERRVAEVGHRLEEPEEGHACSHHGHACGLAPQHGMTLVGAAGGLLLVGLALAYVPGLQRVPEIVETLCYVSALALAGWYPTRSALSAVRNGRLDIETLMVLAAVCAGAMGAWFEGGFLIFLFSLGHSLEHRAMEQARRAVESLAKLRPDTARVRGPSGLEERPVSSFKRGDRLIVRPGDRVPLDGTVREGVSYLDQSALTGESIPVAKGPGDPVLAGTLNADGMLEVEVTRLGGESRIARLVDLVTQAEAHKSRIQRATARIEQIFVPIVLAAAPLTVAVCWLGFDMSVRDAFLRGLGLLVAASPCALAISTPAAVLSAVARGARGGVLIKGGAHLDALGTAQVIAFDKTGTLTHGKPRLVTVWTPTGTFKENMLRLAAGAESLSAHPIARAITEGAAEWELDVPQATGMEAVHGKGLRAQVEGKPVEIGNIELFGRVPDGFRRQIETIQNDGQTTMIVRAEGRFLGVLGVADTLRPEAREAVESLRRLGVARCILLSGDHAQVAKAVAKQVGITEVRAPLMPEDKVKAMRSFAAGEVVAMVGDGVNDAPALAAASVGISLGGAGSDVALETADVVLMGDDLRKLAFAVGLSRAAARVVRQNLTIAIGVSAVLSVASVLGEVGIAEAVILHEGSTLLVVANGLRLLIWKQR